MEDPVEDVFVSNVIAPGGNYRLFEGIWELNDSSVQAVVEALARSPWRRQAPPVLPSVLALLRLSEAVAERAGTPRWTVPNRTTPETELLQPSLNLDVLRSRVSFSWTELESLSIYAQDLESFILAEALHGRIRSESLGHTSLERFPVLRTDDGLILACPSAVGPAIRRYVLEACNDTGATDELASALRWVHSRGVFDGALPRVDAPAGLGGTPLPKAPLRPSAPLPWDEVHCPIDVEKAAVVVLLSDSLVDAARTGLSEPANDPDRGRRLGEHLRKTATRLATTATGGGLVVVVHAGIGRGLVLGVPNLPPRWHAVVMSAGDFGTFARSPSASLLRLWKLEEQRERLAGAGIEVPDTNGTLNTYAFWITHDFSLAPSGIPYPSEARTFVQIGTEFVHGFRVEERRLHDVHAVVFDRGAKRMVRVHRLGRAAFFPTMLERPLYVSEEAAQMGELVGVCEHLALTVWVIASKPAGAPEANYFVYQIWEALLSWLDRLVPEVASSLLVNWPAATSIVSREQTPLRLLLELADENVWSTLSDPGEPSPAPPTVRFERELHRIIVSIPFGFVSLLRRPTNDGERALLEAVAEALLETLFARAPDAAHDRYSPEQLRAMASDAVERAMRNADARHVHLFEAVRPTDEIAALRPGRGPEPRFVFDEDVMTWSDGLAWQVFDRETLPLAENVANDTAQSDSSHVRVITGRVACTQALANVVLAIWTRLRTDLKQINGPSLVALTLENLEHIMRDRGQWRRTARALLALYGEADDVAKISTEREANRAIASAAGRVLVEMAVCACPSDKGRRAALTDLDHLVAGVSELIGLAFDSDAIHSGLAAPQIRIEPNGSVVAERTFLNEVVAPFSTDVHRSEFRASAAAYEDLYRRRTARGGTVEAPISSDGADNTYESLVAHAADAPEVPVFNAEFSTAFNEEFGITPGRVIDGFAELLDIGLEGEALVVSTTRGFIATRLTAMRSFSEAEIESFFAMLALFPRPQWDETPAGFRKRDWEPWRFRRRLSLISRPLVACGPVDEYATPVFYGLDHLGASVSYLFENTQSAWLPAEFFTSDAMIRYRGRVADEEGAAFTQDVAEALRSLGWRVLTEVQMPTLGASAELGDLDVVAWRDDGERVLLIECKRLQPARTVGEIAELLKQFRGEGKDRLGRHIRRCEWVRAHPEALTRRLGVSVRGSDIRPALVTNRQVPMRFVADLPLSPEQIFPLDALAEHLASQNHIGDSG